MLNNLLAKAPLLSGVGGVTMLDAIPGEGTISLALKAIIAISSLIATIWSHKKLNANIKVQEKAADVVKQKEVIDTTITKILNEKL